MNLFKLGKKVMSLMIIMIIIVGANQRFVAKAMVRNRGIETNNYKIKNTSASEVK